MQSASDARKQLVVVGGGVAGVCCVEELEGLVEDGSYDQADITLICGSHGFIKTVTNAEQLTQLMVSFDVAESSAEAFFESRSVSVVQDDAVAWNPSTKVTWKYVPGHANIHGNEMADKLAREGANMYG